MVDLQSTLIHRENAALRKRSLNRRDLKTTAIRFHVDRNHQNRGFSNDDFTNMISFLHLSVYQTQIQNDRWLLRFKISPANCGRKTFDAFSQ